MMALTIDDASELRRSVPLLRSLGYVVTIEFFEENGAEWATVDAFMPGDTDDCARAGGAGMSLADALRTVVSRIEAEVI